MSAPALARGGTFINIRDGYIDHWSDVFRVDKIADPEQAFADARQAHQYVTRELAGAESPVRQFNLIAERNRLAAIAWELKRRL